MDDNNYCSIYDEMLRMNIFQETDQDEISNQRQKLVEESKRKHRKIRVAGIKELSSQTKGKKNFLEEPSSVNNQPSKVDCSHKNKPPINVIFNFFDRKTKSAFGNTSKAIQYPGRVSLIPESPPSQNFVESIAYKSKLRNFFSKKVI